YAKKGSKTGVNFFCGFCFLMLSLGSVSSRMLNVHNEVNNYDSQAIAHLVVNLIQDKIRNEKMKFMMSQG
ncbi:MAG: hypothetical protein ACYTXY_52135, partial [Nostoc sp.]